jgi:hypothetical protein
MGTAAAAETTMLPDKAALTAKKDHPVAIAIRGRATNPA